MKILKPELSEMEGKTAVRARVVSSLGEDWLYFRVPSCEAAALAPDTSDAFLMGLLPVAMALGEDVECAGPVSETLLFNISHGYAEVLKAQIPLLKNNRVHAEATNAFDIRGNTVGTGISGGLDSSHVIADFHLSPDVPETMRVRQLLFFNVGSHGDGNRDKANALFARRLHWLQQAADTVGLPLLTVDSNLSDFYDSVKMNHALTTTARNVAAAMSVQARISRYLLASGPTWTRTALAPSTMMEDTDPFSLPLCRTERFDAISVGGELSRGEKLERVVKYEFVRDFLRPCYRDGENCGRCSKCRNVQLGLEILGVLPEFNRVFDLDKWQKTREPYIALVRRSNMGSHPGWVRFAADRNYSLSVSLRARVKQRLHEIDDSMPDSVRRFWRNAMIGMRMRSKTR